MSPLRANPGAGLWLKPVMSLVSNLIAVREHKAGEPVGYGGTWISERDTRLAWWRWATEMLSACCTDRYTELVNGREVNIVGRVAMDMICVTLDPTPRIKR
ncbi:MAG: alanine racemase C-terminal domain-containing protein [Escherichia coli]